MLWLRDLFPALSSQRHGFNSRRLHFVNVAVKMALEQVFSKYFGVSLLLQSHGHFILITNVPQ